ncbi:hypothetical protein [Marinomonas gallaica]|uniref:hypothetical protein n=1 Tax=Marinomonas gallaica TaxID=1806667 RepID=UPI00082F43F0|nr:hypothetical protein [Marinomonas gallaica]
MWLDHDVIVRLVPARDDFKFYPCIEIPDQYAFTFLAMLRKLIEQPYPLEILHISLHPDTNIPETQLISGCPNEILGPTLDRFGHELRKCIHN